MKTRVSAVLGCLLWAAFPLHTSATEGSDPSRITVRIDTTSRIAEESSYPYRRLNYVGEFTISRSGPTNESLSVFIGYSGSATYGVDYPNLPLLGFIPAGATSTVVRVGAKPDDTREPIETLVATISNCAPDREPNLLLPCHDFDIAPAHGSATVFLRDDGITESSIAITRPKDGDAFKLGETISIEAVAIDLNGYISHVDFYDGGRKIGESQIFFIVAPDPGTPIHHSFDWTGAAAGSHVLTAGARLSDGLPDNSLDGSLVISQPVRITVETDTPVPAVVSIEATRPIAEEDSAPLERLPLVGEFTVSRTGPTNTSLPVFLHISGTATPGKDYQALPWLISVPAGASSVSVRVEAIPDGETEGLETVVARISNCPPDIRPAPGIPCYFFEIDPARSQATVVVRDDGVTRASLAITQPADGSRFEEGRTIPIEAIAIALDGHIPRVEFFDGDRFIGESEIVFIREPDPGTPILHHFDWTGAAVGLHTLKARAAAPNGDKLESQSVRVVVGLELNQLPSVAIVRPQPGATFPINTPIEIVAEARDPDGYARRAEFFADGRKIGEQTLDFLVPPPPGETQTFDFLWRMPEAGLHRLTVRVTDDRGGVGLSPVVGIAVAPGEVLPVVTVFARDCFASEPSTDNIANTATFIVRRHGPTNAALTVSYSLGGTAGNGIDYERLDGTVTIPAGRRAAPVVIRPLADNLAERYETVTLRLEPAPDSDPGTYLIGRPSGALAVISDLPWIRFVADGPCQRLDRDCAFVVFGADAGFNYRVEASDDLRSWETLCVQAAIDQAVHFVDPDAGNHRTRFYRIAPEPAPAPEE